MKRFSLLFNILILVSFAMAQDLSTWHPIAKYPFGINGADAIGNNPDATIQNAPFQQGSIYSTGIYPGGVPNGCTISTPQIDSMDYANFAITLDFKPDTLDRPVLVCGEPWRWLIVQTSPDSNVLQLLANKTNGFSQFVNTGKAVQVGTWYHMGIIYDSTSRTLSFYIDNTLIKSTVMTAQLAFHNMKKFGNTDGGAGETYKGWWKQLTVYAKNPAGINLHQGINAGIFPNPVADIVHLTYNSEDAIPLEVTVFDMLGREVQRIRENGFYGIHQIPLDLSFCQSGSYLLYIEQGEKRQSLLLQKL